MSEGAMSEEKLPNATGDPRADMLLGEPRLVTVKMFERDYQIMSDQPELVELLAAEINREARRLMELNPAKMGPGYFDWPVQVAFRLALHRYRTQEAYNTLKAQVEEDAGSMADRILASLGKD
jgi:hypothetical protein